MTRALSLITLLAAGCIFGGNKDKTPDDNDNNVVDMGGDVAVPDDMSSPEDMAVEDVPTPEDMMMPPDVTVPDMAPPPQTYLALDAEEQMCGSPRTKWFAPSGDVQTEITQNSFVTTGDAPTDRASNMPYLGGRASVAYATKSGSNIGVFAAVVGAADGDDQFTSLTEIETNIDTSADLFGIVLTPIALERSNDAPVGDLLSILLPTSMGVYECVMTVDQSDNPNMTCAESPWNQTVQDLEIAQPVRIDPAPIFERLANGDYGLNLLGFDLVAAVSGPSPTGGETIGLLRADTDGAVSEIAIQNIETTTPGRTFGERLAFGVTGESFGFPVLLMLRDSPSGVEPIALRANNLSGSVYARFDVGPWSLSNRVVPARRNFTFVDGYDVMAGLLLTLFPPRLGARFPPGSSNLGYAAIAEEGGSVVFSRPGNFSQNTIDFLEFDELIEPSEIAAFKNVAATGRSPVAVIHGADRDRLAVIDWGFGIDAKYVDDLLAPEYDNARRIAPNWWFDNSGTISMLARRDGQWVVAAALVPDLEDLTGACD